MVSTVRGVVVQLRCCRTNKSRRKVDWVGLRAGASCASAPLHSHMWRSPCPLSLKVLHNFRLYSVSPSSSHHTLTRMESTLGEIVSCLRNLLFGVFSISPLHTNLHQNAPSYKEKTVLVVQFIHRLALQRLRIYHRPCSMLILCSRFFDRNPF